MRAALEEHLVHALPVLQRLPRRVDAIAAAVQSGEAQLRVRWLADPSDRSYITSVVNNLVITVRVEVTDPTAVLSHPCAMHLYTGPDGETDIYLPSSVEEAVVARFTALLDQMYEPWAGLQVCEHCERLASWDHRRP